MASDHNRYLREVDSSRLIGLEKICFNKANKAGRPTRQVGRQGRWARSIDVPTLTVIILWQTTADLMFTTKQMVHTINQFIK
jgi:hypothetical protein